MYVTAFNTSSTPVTVDAEGRQIGGKDWGTAETTDDLARELIDSKVLVVHENIPDDGHPDAVAARDRTRQIAARVEQFAAIDKPDLAALAGEVGVEGAEDAHKPHLAHALASRLDVPVPATSTDEEPTTEIQGETIAEPREEQPREDEPAEPAKPTSRSRRAGRE